MRRPTIVSIVDGLPRPRWRGRLHAVGFSLTMGAAPALLWLADSITARLAGLVYVVSLLALFGTSASYHLLARSERAQRVMRRLDHSMIFALIAGTYTPVCLLALPPRWGWPILVTTWTTTLVGMALKLFGGDRLLRASNGLYPFVGWVAVLALPIIIEHLTGSELALLVAGGVLYSIGALLFFLRRPRLRPHVFGYHEVWHSCTMLAAAAHFAMVWSVTG